MENVTSATGMLVKHFLRFGKIYSNLFLLQVGLVRVRLLSKMLTRLSEIKWGLKKLVEIECKVLKYWWSLGRQAGSPYFLKLWSELIILVLFMASLTQSCSSFNNCEMLPCLVY